MKITDMKIRNISVPLKRSLRHGVGAHPGRFIFTLIELNTNEGITGFGEVGGGGFSLEQLFRFLKGMVIGEDPLNVRRLRWKVASPITSTYYNQLLPQMWFAIETALLDIKGKALSAPVHSLLGGKIRDEVPIAGYLFPTEREETPEEFTAFTKRLVQEYDFSIIKLKTGVFSPQHEVDVIKAMSEALPNVKFRIDPNGAWSLSDAIRVYRCLRDIPIEYYEDPVWSMEGLREFRQATGAPVATNTAITRIQDIPHAYLREAVSIILGDPHWYYGCTGFIELAAIAWANQFELGMHSPGETGIGLSSMLHSAACTPNLGYAIDTHYIHLEEDLLKKPIVVENGATIVRDLPGFGIEVDLDKVEKFESLYSEAGEYKYNADTARGEWFPTIPHLSYSPCKCGHTGPQRRRA